MFIEVVDAKGPVSINVNNIVKIEKLPTFTNIFTTDGNAMTVEEPYEHVMQKVKAATKG